MNTLHTIRQGILICSHTHTYTYVCECIAAVYSEWLDGKVFTGSRYDITRPAAGHYAVLVVGC